MLRSIDATGDPPALELPGESAMKIAVTSHMYATGAPIAARSKALGEREAARVLANCRATGIVGMPNAMVPGGTCSTVSNAGATPLPPEPGDGSAPPHRVEGRPA